MENGEDNSQKITNTMYTQRVGVVGDSQYARQMEGTPLQVRLCDQTLPTRGASGERGHTVRRRAVLVSKRVLVVRFLLVGHHVAVGVHIGIRIGVAALVITVDWEAWRVPLMWRDVAFYAVEEEE